MLATVAAPVLFAWGLLCQESAPTTEGGSPCDAEMQAAIERARPSLVQVFCTSAPEGRAGTSACPTACTIALSGVVVDSEGRVVTTADAVDGAVEVRARFATGEERTATILGVDRATDLAVLDVGRVSFEVSPLADVEDLRPGTLVVAIGNPYGLRGTATVGHVTGAARAIQRKGKKWPYEGLVQISAPVLPGDPGGILANRNGELAGVLFTSLDLRASYGAAEANGSGEAVPGGGTARDGTAASDSSPRAPRASAAAAHAWAPCVSFAWPAHEVRDAVERALRHDDGFVRTRRRLRLGVLVDEHVVAGGGPATVRRLLVRGVVPGSAAARAGVRPQDVLVAAEGTALPDVRALRLALEEARERGLLRLEIARDGQPLVEEICWEANETEP